VCIVLGLSSAGAQSPADLHFEHQTVDSQVAIGYGIALEDVDGDGKKDILLADKKQFVWYRNPDWKRFVMVSDLTELDNVCIAARDLDGDGKVEVAVGAQWNPGDTVNSGSVHYLIPPADRTELWTPVQLHHEPVVHRMRWVRTSGGKYVLVVAPLHGRGNRGGEGAGVQLLAYTPPADPRDPWKTELLDDTLHVTHNFDRGAWVERAGDAEDILYLGREAALLLTHDDQGWHKRQLAEVQGGGEIRMGRLADGTRYLATIEPFHGERLVVYRFDAVPAGEWPTRATSRTVLAEDFVQGHAIATGDLLGAGYDQIVAGWRNANQDGKVGLKWYRTSDGKRWEESWVDDNQMACEDARLADLDGDGRLDIVAAGRDTHNLKIYWNRPGNSDSK
jgi:hypothetical protein